MSPPNVKRTDVEHGPLSGAIFEAVPDAVVVMDESGRLIRVNSRTEAMFGYRSAELLGQTVEMLLPDRLRDRHAIHREGYTAQPRARPMGTGREFVARRKDGREFPADVALSTLPTEDGLLVLATIVDTTVGKQRERERDLLLEELAEERRWLRALIERSPIGIIFVEGADGERIVANRRAEVLFGHPLPSEMGIAQLIEYVCHADGSACPFDEFPATRALRGDVVSGAELLLRRLDGRELPVLVNTGPIRDAAGQVTGAIAVLDDLTPIKELERLRQEWTSVIAHDLRQPVTVIIGYVGHLAKQREANADAILKPLEHIRASAHQLSRMINDLLDVSRLEARRLTIDRRDVDLPSLVTTVVERMNDVTVGHAVRVAVNQRPIPSIRADPSRLEQVLGNLLSNAAKYGFPGTEIQVEVDRHPGEVEVAVVNHGDGIYPEELPRLFTRFHRPIRPESQRVPGLGLGLYITKGLIEAHGGRIWAESIPGQTTVFRFTLPERGE